MKKLLLAFGFMILMPALAPAEAGVINYWDYWQNRSQAESSSDSNRYNSYARPRYSTGRSYRSTTVPRTTTTRTSTAQTQTGTTSRSRWMNYLRSRYSNRLGTSTRSSNSYSTPSRTVSATGVTATVTPITLRQDINEITAAPVDLFRVGVSHNDNSRDFVEAVNIDEMQFQIVDNTGVVSDFSDFSLVTEDQEFDFDSQGYATLRFRNLRLASGESRGLDLSIKIEDPDNFPRLSGSFRVKLAEVTAYRESSLQRVNVKMSGRTVSDYVVLNPRASVSAGGTVGANVYGSQTVVGRPLGGNEKAFILTLNLGASYDDFLLEKLTATNQYGSNADQLVSRVNLIDLSSGAVLDTTQFVAGKAVFDLPRSKQLFIGRNSRVKLGIEVQIVSSPNVDAIDNRLKLLVTGPDIELFGVGAGRDVPDGQKTVSLDSETFTVSNATLTAQGGIAFSSTQPPLFPTGTLGQVARFKITNGGTQDVSFGRLTLQVIPNGVAFVGGGIPSDFELVELFNGVSEFPRFSVTGVSSNVATFDANSEIYIDAGETREFALKAALNNTGSSSDSDGVSVVLLGDSTLTKGTLSAVRGAGARFIWSDHSGRPHTASSTDWFSGFQFPGVPTNAFVNTRR